MNARRRLASAVGSNSFVTRSKAIRNNNNNNNQSHSNKTKKHGIWKVRTNPHLINQMIYYQEYHRNIINKIIHFLFVPMIFWSILVWCAYTAPVIIMSPDRDNIWKDIFPMNSGLIIFLLYIIYYVSLDYSVGYSWIIFMGIPSYVSAYIFKYYIPGAWIYATFIQLISWFFQIYYGHIRNEKRHPPLIDSMFQSIVQAPLFSWYELIFIMGLRKELKIEIGCRFAAREEERINRDRVTNTFRRRSIY